MDVVTMLMVGVGGQGILRASDIVSLVIMKSGYDVKKSEVHGMAQRGGCVSSFVRYGRKVYSPIASKGDVDILIAFEKLESLRYIDYLHADSLLIINDREIPPPSVNLGLTSYPKNITEILLNIFKKVQLIDAMNLAREAGDVRTENMILLGALSCYLNEFAVSIWCDVIRNSFPPNVVDVNMKAFTFGRASVQSI